MGFFCGESWSWVFRWGRIFNANDLLEFLELWNCVWRCKILAHKTDSISWVDSSDELFSTRSMYGALSNDDSGATNVSSLSKVWWKTIPVKVSAFCWKLLQDRIHTKENLSKRNILSADQSLACAFCSESPESASHLMIECQFTAQV
ncbi:uncharacterized protein LOC131023492 [Salvia miltiorrhiza]|uniref:uncharacterized protein LOC131023492 n=1 Tax=Salvia miltiorrhiza TaxID=226208 RepID=UPI0025ACF31A|nr:uncharacterized protein LOC131023492 [Salvia miltiorrhiza]